MAEREFDAPMEAEYQRLLAQMHADRPFRDRLARAVVGIGAWWVLLAVCGVIAVSVGGGSGLLAVALAFIALVPCLSLFSVFAPERTARRTVRRTMMRLDEMDGPQNPFQFLG